MTHRLIRAATALAAGSVMVALVSPAAAAPPRPAFESIPKASFPAEPAWNLAPESIASREKASGITVNEAPRRGSRRPVASRQPTRFFVGTPAPDACLSLGEGAASGRRIVVSDASPMVTVRRLRIGESRGNPFLEIADYWVDPTSRGSRREALSRLPLLQIGREWRGVSVYAFRDDSLVHFVVRLPEHSAAVGPLENRSTRSSCGAVVFGLAPSDEGSAASMTVAVLDPAHEREVARLDPEHRTRAAHDAIRHSMHVVRVSASVSQLSRDPKPVVGVTVGPGEPELKRALAGILASRVKKSLLDAR